MTVRFGPFVLDSERRLLTRGSELIHLTPKAFALLQVLVAEAPRVVTKRELHERLWPGVFVSDASLTVLVKELRRALADGDPDAQAIRTAHGVGYACALEVVSTAGRRAPGQHWLVFRDRRVALQDGENIIGRDPDAHVWLDSPSVSRRHARIAIEDAIVRLEDLGSKNGTKGPDGPIRDAIELSDGDRIQLGDVAAVYRSSGAGMSTETRSASRIRHAPARRATREKA